MKTLITYINGLIAPSLAQHLFHAGHDIYGKAKEPSKMPASHIRLRQTHQTTGNKEPQ